MWKWIIGAAAVILAFLIGAEWPALKSAATWQRFDSPGRLSKAHAFIGENCAACHQSVAGVTRTRCVACHANSGELLQRQPTAFHASISACAPCHYEHQRGVERPIHMDHAALARIGLAQLGEGGLREQELRTRLRGWMRASAPPNTGAPLSAEERILDCNSCHTVNDVHSGNFGANCASCHGTTSWFIAGYVHPSPSARQCAQCHSASPCHFMEECLGMMQKMAGGEGARLDECYLCHKTTNWYDFRRSTTGIHQ